MDSSFGAGLRSLAAFLALTLAALMVPVVVVGGWVHRTVSDTDTFAAESRDVLADEAVLASVSTVLANEIIASFNKQSGAKAALDGLLDGGRLPGPVEAQLRASNRDLGARLHESLVVVIRQAMATEAFEAAWIGSVRAVHEQLIETLARDRPLTVADGTVSLDLARAGKVVKKELRAAGFTGVNRIPDFSGSYDLVDAEKLEKPRQAYRMLDTWVPRAPWILLVSLVLGTALARRRLKSLSRTASLAGFLLVLCQLGVALGGKFIAEQVIDRDMNNVVVVTWQQITDALTSRVWWLVIILGAASIALRVAAWLVARAQREAEGEDEREDLVPGLR